MSVRKRSISVEEPNLKKTKVLDSLSEDGPLTQEDVIYFQKEAIYRRLKLYKEELELTSKNLEVWKIKCKLNRERLSLLDGWWLNIIEILQQNSLVNDGNVAKIDENFQSIDLVKNKYGGIFTISGDFDQNDIEDILNIREKLLINLIFPLIKEGSNTHNLKDVSIHRDLESVLGDLASEKSKRSALNEENQILNDTVISLKAKLLNLVRENERFKSITLRKTDEALAEVKTEDENGDSRTNGHLKLGSNSKKTEENTINGESNNIKDEGKHRQNEFPELEYDGKIKEMQTVINSLENQIKETQSVSLTFKQKVSDLELRLLNLTSYDLENCMIYKNLVSSNEKLVNINNEFRMKEKTLIKKIAALESDQSKFTSELQEKYLEERKSLETQLEKSESDLARVRTMRDELTSKLDICKTEKKSKELYDELLKTIKAQKIEINGLRSRTIGDLQAASTEVDTSSLEENSMLKVQNEALIEELKNIEVAFNSAQEQLNKKFESLINNENMITKLKLEKNKADQKYFATMRAKDTLNNDLKTLKVQQARSNEVIAQLKEVEKLHQDKIKILENSLEDFKMLASDKDKEYESLKNKSLEIAQSFESLKRNFNLLTNEKKTNVLKLHESGETEMKLRKDIEQLKAKISSNEKIIRSYSKKLDNGNNGGTSDIQIAEYKEDSKRIAGLISIAKCSICTTRFKDTALKSCGHVFCFECINNRLNARMRKCPSCNGAFSANDLLSVHL